MWLEVQEANRTEDIISYDLLCTVPKALLVTTDDGRKKTKEPPSE